MSLSERIEQINREIGATVERMLTDLRQDVAQRLRASTEEIARHVEELSPELPGSFLAHEDVSPFAEEMARQAAQQAAQEAAREATEAARREAAQAAETSSSAARDAVRETARTASREALSQVRDALAGIDRGRSQAEILAALLREAGRFTSRAAVVLVRGDELRGWAGQGFGDADARFREIAFTPSATGGWTRVVQGGGAAHLSAADCAELCSRLEAPLPHAGALIPLVLRDRVAACLYADRDDDPTGGLPAVEALQTLGYVAAQAIELLPFRERASTPTLATDEGLAAALAAAHAAPAPAEEPAAAEPEPQAAPAAEATAEEIEVEAEPEVPESAGPVPVEALSEAPAPWTETAPASEESPEESPEALPEALAEPEELPEPEPEADPTASPAATVFQPIPREAPGSSAGDALPSPATLTAPLPLPSFDGAPENLPASPDATVLLQRPNLRDVSAESPAPPSPLRPVPPPLPVPPAAEPAAAAEAPTTNLSGIPEVKPPSGVDGPGWAFATSRVPAHSPGEDALHEEARRLARLLVSEIKLYNEEQVEEGRRKRDVYERLKEDIDRSRQMYEERVEPRILKSTDYFYQELVRILAAGDAKALGI